MRDLMRCCVQQSDRGIEQLEKIAVQNQRSFGFSSGTSFNLSRVLVGAVQLQCRSELRSLVFRSRSHTLLRS